MTINGNKNLNGHQIDILRRSIKFLIERDGKARLVILAAHLITLKENGFKSSYWCGYHKLRTMLEAYPEFFEIYGQDPTDMSVRIVDNNNPSGNQMPMQHVDMNFDHYIHTHISREFADEICREFNLKDGLEDYCVFLNYLRYTYYKASAEGKVLELNNLRMFHTGWLHNNTDEVYMLWGYDNDGVVQRCLMRRSGREARNFIRIFGNRVPQLAEYPVLQFDTNLHIEPEYGHIIDEHADRIPKDTIAMLRYQLVHEGYDENLSEQEIVYRSRNYLRRLFDGCILDTRKRLGNRADDAVLFWNRRTDKMCWFIPLRLGLTENVNLTLVVEPNVLNGEPIYRAHTILPLREAFKCARLLGPVRAEWLRDALKTEDGQAN